MKRSAQNSVAQIADAYLAAEQRVLINVARKRNCHVVFCNGQPFYTALTASTAYSLFSALRRAGQHSVYRPL